MNVDAERSPKLRHDPPDIPGYELSTREAIPINRLGILSLFGLIPAIVTFVVAGLLIVQPDEFVIRFAFTPLLIIVSILLILMPIVHEAVHGMIALLLGSRPFFGIGSGYAYTSFRESVSPVKYGAITLAPLILLSAITIVGFVIVPDWFLYLIAFGAGNATGSIGDLWIFNRIRKLPRNARVYDLADGYAAFVPKSDSPKE